MPYPLFLYASVGFRWSMLPPNMPSAIHGDAPLSLPDLAA